MRLTDRITEESDRHQKVEESLKAELSALIAGLPDNPRIHRLLPNCFVMSFKDMGRRWSPENHNFKAQYQAILGLLDGVPLGQGVQRVRSAIAEGSIRIANGGNSYTLHFHPDVIAHVEKALAGV